MAGADSFAIMKAMSHADIKTTMIYISLEKTISKSRWRNQTQSKYPDRDP